MKRTILSALIFIMSLSMLNAQPGDQSKNPDVKLLRHVVLFKFKATATVENVKTVEDAFLGLRSTIPQIKDMEWGINNSPENLNQELTHCFFLTFASEKDRNDYLVDPAHKAFGNIVKPYLDKVTVIDYWMKR